MLCPIAAIISPFFLGMMADRFFSSEKVLAVLMIFGGVAMFFVPAAAKQGAERIPRRDPHSRMCYMPTLGLTNTIAFANMTNQEKQFPLVRVFGTIGWIVAGLIISFVLHADATSQQFLLAGAAAVVMGLFSFALPHTPPPAKGKKARIGEILGVDALALFKSRIVHRLRDRIVPHLHPAGSVLRYAGRTRHATSANPSAAR